MQALFLSFQWERDQDRLCDWKSSVLIRVIAIFVFGVKFEFVGAIPARGCGRCEGNIVLLEEG